MELKFTDTDFKIICSLSHKALLSKFNTNNVNTETLIGDGWFTHSELVNNLKHYDFKSDDTLLPIYLKRLCGKDPKLKQNKSILEETSKEAKGTRNTTKSVKAWRIKNDEVSIRLFLRAYAERKDWSCTSTLYFKDNWQTIRKYIRFYFERLFFTPEPVSYVANFLFQETYTFAEFLLNIKSYADRSSLIFEIWKNAGISIYELPHYLAHGILVQSLTQEKHSETDLLKYKELLSLLTEDIKLKHKLSPDISSIKNYTKGLSNRDAFRKKYHVQPWLNIVIQGEPIFEKVHTNNKTHREAVAKSSGN